MPCQRRSVGNTSGGVRAEMRRGPCWCIQEVMEGKRSHVRETQSSLEQRSTKQAMAGGELPRIFIRQGLFIMFWSARAGTWL